MAEDCEFLEARATPDKVVVDRAREDAVGYPPDADLFSDDGVDYRSGAKVLKGEFGRGFEPVATGRWKSQESVHVLPRIHLHDQNPRALGRQVHSECDANQSLADAPFSRDQKEFGRTKRRVGSLR